MHQQGRNQNNDESIRAKAFVNPNVAWHDWEMAASKPCRLWQSWYCGCLLLWNMTCQIRFGVHVRLKFSHGSCDTALVWMGGRLFRNLEPLSTTRAVQGLQHHYTSWKSFGKANSHSPGSNRLCGGMVWRWEILGSGNASLCSWTLVQGESNAPALENQKVVLWHQTRWNVSICFDDVQSCSDFASQEGEEEVSDALPTGFRRGCSRQAPLLAWQTVLSIAFESGTLCMRGNFL